MPLLVMKLKNGIFWELWSRGTPETARCEAKCEKLLRGVTHLRRQLEHLEMALKQFLGSREKTYMYYKVQRRGRCGGVQVK